ncbi:MAG: Rieske 2Fe-2S domain-containing protein [Chloroflexota bacterium]
MRFFFGFTFLYAGLDKLVDPSFLNADAAGSITAQFEVFARSSPLAVLVRAAEPFAVPIGLLIALAEIAIGLGALSGLAYRLAAAGGAALSLLFFLTASWSTRPFYFGPDLPYAFGWLALAIAGTDGLLVPGFVRELTAGIEAALPWGRSTPAPARGPVGSASTDAVPGISRRQVVEVGLVGVATLAVAALAVPVRVLRGDDARSADASDPASVSPGSSSTASASSTPIPGGPTSAPQASATPGFTPSGLTVATTAQVNAKGAVRIRVPVSAPAPLPAGDPALVVRLKSGGYACYDAVCTHEGCRVGWDAQDSVMLCPCHGAAFDPNDHGAVLQGPTDQPLLELPITIDSQTGAITLKA